MKCVKKVARDLKNEVSDIFEELGMDMSMALAKHSEGADLISGNKKHYPPKANVVSPSEMMAIVDGDR